MLALGIGNGRTQHLFNSRRNALVDRAQNIDGIARLTAADHVDHQPRLLRRDAHIAGFSFCERWFIVRHTLFRRLFVGLRRVTLESPRRRKFTQLVAHHVLGHVHRNELLAVMHRQRVADEIRHDRRAARPRLHHRLLIFRDSALPPS